MDANLRINDIQVIGTHNSYKQPMAPELLAAHRLHDPVGADSLDYGHRPLAEQLDRGVRGLELDIFFDPQGGRYTHASLSAGRREGGRGVHREERARRPGSAGRDAGEGRGEEEPGRGDVPEPIRSTAEYRELCPASAAVMMREIERRREGR